MAALNYSNIGNIQPYPINTTLLESSTEIVSGAQTMATDVSGGWYWFMILLALYVFLLMVINNKNGDFRLDFLATNVFASGVCFMLAGLGLVLGFTNSYADVSFFGTIFFIFVIGKYLNRTKTP